MKGWSQSEQWRQIARAAIQAYNARRATLPKCGALARHTGQPCRNIALANGRCRYHGGRTPSGDKWHKAQWPSRQHVRAEQHFARKLQRLEKARAEKERRLSEMTFEEREAYSRWRASHPPGDAAKRAQSRELRRRNREGATLLRSLSDEPFAGAAGLEDLIELLQAQIAQLQRKSELGAPDFDIFA